MIICQDWFAKRYHFTNLVDICNCEQDITLDGKTTVEHVNRKRQDYVFVKGEYQSTL